MTRHVIFICLMLHLVACLPVKDRTNAACQFPMPQPPITEWSAEAQDAFERALAYDIDVILDTPELIRPDLRGADYNRQDAKLLYQKAVDLGHIPALGSLAYYHLKGFGRTDGTFKSEPKVAFKLMSRLAEAGDYRGYQGMGVLIYEGLHNSQPNPDKGARCMERAATIAPPNDLVPALALAEMDLGVRLDALTSALNPPRRLERGIRLFEDLVFRDEPEAYKALETYYRFRDPNPRKAEYYARLMAQHGHIGAQSSMKGGYGAGDYGPPDEAMGQCIRDLDKNIISRIEELCPLPDGPLTRAGVGLPPAQTEPLDIPAYLTALREQNPDM